MYKVIKDEKIIGVFEERPSLLDSYEVIEDEEHTPDDYEQYNGAWYLAGHAPQKPQAMIAAERIVELKALLAGTDYKAIKYSEGVVSEEEYAETKALRIAWRAEINQLESELSS